jgi:hypothetical protein
MCILCRSDRASQRGYASLFFVGGFLSPSSSCPVSTSLRHAILTTPRATRVCEVVKRMQQTPDLEKTAAVQQPAESPKDAEGSTTAKPSRRQRVSNWLWGGKAGQNQPGPMKKITCAKDCCLTVYLDEGAVHTVYNEVIGPLTLSAEIERTISSSEGLKRAIAVEGGIEYLIGRVKAEGSQETTASEQVGETSKAAYSRTYQALFNEVRSKLKEDHLLTELADRPITPEELSKLSEYDFVELSGHVYPNPIVRTLSFLTELANLSVKDKVQEAQATVLSDLYTADALPPRAKRFVDASKPESVVSLDEDQATLAEFVPRSLSTICSTLASAEVKLFVAYLTNLQDGTWVPWRYPVVMTLFTGWARDKSMTEISDRQFRILGKVVRNWKGPDAVDLFRGTKYNGLGNYINLSLIMPYFTAMATRLKKKMPDEAPDKLKTLEEKDVLEAQFGWNPLESLTIQAPVLEIVPLALYL